MDFTIQIVLLAVVVGITIFFWRRTRKISSEAGTTKKSDKKGHTHDEYDGMLTRSRGARWFVLIAFFLTMLIVPASLLSWVLGRFTEFPGNVWLYYLIGFVISGELLARSLQQFLVQVPQVQGFVTLNPFQKRSNPNVIYGPGIHIAFPWEERSRKSNFTSEVITLPWSEEVPGLDTQLKVTGSYQFKVDLLLASRFIGIDNTTITGGVIDLIKAEVSSYLSTMSGDDAKKEINKLNTHLIEKFGEAKEKAGDEDLDRSTKQFAQLEEDYGIETIKVTVTGIDFPDKVQETRDAKDQAAQVFNGVAAMLKRTPEKLASDIDNGQLSNEMYLKYVDRFLAKSGTGTLEVKVYDVPDAVNLAAAAAGFLKKG